jgi:hypothetical protein
MDRSWIRNSETGEDRPECLRVLYYTNSIDRADAWIVDNEKTIDLGNMLLIWDNESPKWDQYVDNSLVHGAA